MCFSFCLLIVQADVPKLGFVTLDFALSMFEPVLLSRKNRFLSRYPWKQRRRFKKGWPFTRTCTIYNPNTIHHKSPHSPHPIGSIYGILVYETYMLVDFYVFFVGFFPFHPMNPMALRQHMHFGVDCKGGSQKDWKWFMLGNQNPNHRETWIATKKIAKKKWLHLKKRRKFTSNLREVSWMMCFLYLKW